LFYIVILYHKTLYIILASYCRYTTWLYECGISSMLKRLKLSSVWRDSGSKELKRGCCDAFGGDWWSLHLAEIWNQFCVSPFGENLASVALKIFHI
jgi:hypothetical protein